MGSLDLSLSSILVSLGRGAAPAHLFAPLHLFPQFTVFLSTISRSILFEIGASLRYA
jgi:hypothetical protein